MEKILQKERETLKTAKSTNSSDASAVWKSVKEQLRIFLTDSSFETWFSSVSLDKLEDGIAYISCDSDYKRNWIEQNTRNIITKILKEVTESECNVIFSVKSSVKRLDTDKQNSPHDEKSEKKESDDKYEYYIPAGNIKVKSVPQNSLMSFSNSISERKDLAYLNKNYTLDSFIVGANNRLAFAVAEAVTESPGKAYNPVFFYGGTGVGKTHLMQAVGNKIIESYSDKSVIYVPTETFLNELIYSIKTRKNEQFRSKYREIDLLILDDIQALENYDKTQEEVFNTFNALYLENKQIIIASDRVPKDIKNLTDRLRSRFEGGMVIDIQPPEKETRIAIIQQIMEERDVFLPKNIVEIIAENIEHNVRQLEGATMKVISMVTLVGKKSGQSLSEEKVRQLLQIDIESKRKRIKPARILEAVSEVFDVSVKELKGKRRTAHVATARQAAMYLMRSILNYPLEKIARELNKSDHTTVIHACNKIEICIKEKDEVKAKIDRCRLIISE